MKKINNLFFSLPLCLLLLACGTNGEINVNTINDIPPRPNLSLPVLEFENPQISVYNVKRIEELNQLVNRLENSDPSKYIVILPRKEWEKLVKNNKNQEILIRGMKLQLDWYDNFYTALKNKSEKD